MSSVIVESLLRAYNQSNADFNRPDQCVLKIIVTLPCQKKSSAAGKSLPPQTAGMITQVITDKMSPYECMTDRAALRR